MSIGENKLVVEPTLCGRKAWVFYLAKTVGRIAFSPFFHLTTEGAEHLPQKESFVILSKHQRWEDIPLLGLASPRPLYYVAKYELFQNPFSGWLLKSLGGIPLNRKSPLKSRRSLRTVVEFLRRGEGIAVFPEGTYYRDRMGPGHIGIVRLILSKTAPPFVPVGIKYSPNGGRVSVHIRFGNPFHKDPSIPANEFLDRIMKDIASLSGL